MGEHQLSYEELVDCIVHDKQVPNILHVPNVTLDPSLSKDSSMRPRLKPWETTATNPVPSVNVPKEASPAILSSKEEFPRSQSSKSLSKYYSIETEFEQQLQNFLGGGDEQISTSESQ
ncbi:LAME_0C01112g1_1 [Lachancea meyersii CBS 8951]|uniref:LAME_0C01112g1_1 n=1 Tax=Lachancea meyersii CBS 8951 TaxID=1266667 RepID=A0A1G4IYV5_9SACH|nr:LAME_0C01112g1_1 [Lachancea meyersii CBS 8951]